MAYKVNFSDECETWLDGLERDLQKAVAAHIGLLAEYGPQLARPYADTVKSPVKSPVKNLKELRVQYRGEPYRILYAFDPKREALLLIGGNKTSDKRWYKRMIPVAEKIFAAHLQSLEE